MFLRNLYNELENNQLNYNGLNTLTKLEQFNLDEKEGKLLFILETLKYGKALGFKIFKESDKELSKQDIKKFLAGAKSYSLNKPIVMGKLKYIIEGLAFEFKDLELNYKLLSGVLNSSLTINDFLNNKEINNLNIGETKGTKVYNTDYLFAGKSGKIYSGKGVNDLRQYKEVDLIDILEGYSGENETLKKIIPYLLNNKDELKKEFKQYRYALSSALSILFNAEKSKAVEYILPKLEITGTNETSTISNVAPF